MDLWLLLVKVVFGAPPPHEELELLLLLKDVLKDLLIVLASVAPKAMAAIARIVLSIFFNLKITNRVSVSPAI